MWAAGILLSETNSSDLAIEVWKEVEIPLLQKQIHHVSLSKLATKTGFQHATTNAEYLRFRLPQQVQSIRTASAEYLLLKLMQQV